MGSLGSVAWSSSNKNTVPIVCVSTVLDSEEEASGTKSSWTCSSSSLRVTPHHGALWICLLIINTGTLPSESRCLTCPLLRSSIGGMSREQLQNLPETSPLMTLERDGWQENYLCFAAHFCWESLKQNGCFQSCHCSQTYQISGLKGTLDTTELKAHMPLSVLYCIVADSIWNISGVNEGRGNMKLILDFKGLVWEREW